MTNYQISTEDKLIYMQIEGSISARDFIRFLTEVSMDEHYNRTFNSIVNLQNFEAMFSIAEAQTIIEAATSIRSYTPVKSAIVANGILKKNLIDTASWLFKSSIEIKGFASMDEAQQWIRSKGN